LTISPVVYFITQQSGLPEKHLQDSGDQFRLPRRLDLSLGDTVSGPPLIIFRQPGERNSSDRPRRVQGLFA
jgi:hypothetical protein